MSRFEPLEIRTLGGFELRRGEAAVPRIASRAGRQLVAFLATRRGAWTPRARVAGALWPDEPENDALRKLSQALWRVRSAVDDALGEPLIESSSGAIRIAGDVPHEVDLALLEDRMASLRETIRSEGAPDLADVRRLVRSYRGGFLPGWYEDWIVDVRVELRRRWLASIAEARDAFRDARAYAAALEVARRAAEEAPLDETHAMALVRLLALLGQRTEAIRRYRAWSEALRTEVGIEPAPESRAVFEELVRAERVGPPSEASNHAAEPGVPLLRSTDSPFVGRTTERRALLDCIDALTSGAPALALVRGDPGVGKSRLLRELRADATWRGVDVLHAGARESDVDRPFAYLRRLLEPELHGLRARHAVDMIGARLAAELGRVVEAVRSLAPAPDPEAEPRVGEAVARLLRGWGGVRPLLLLLDDLQWADRASLDLLDASILHGGLGRVGVVLAYRTEDAHARDEVQHLLDRLDRVERRTSTTRIELERLGQEETLELVQRGLALARRPERFAARLHRETAGNPFFLIQALRSLIETEHLYRDEAGIWHTPFDRDTEDYSELPIGSHVEAQVTSRLERLDANEARLVHTASAAGEALPLETMVEASGLVPADAHAALVALLDRGLLLEFDDRVALAHDVLRQIAYRRMTDRERADAHGGLARAMDADDAVPPEVVGRHAQRAGDLQTAVARFRAAASQAVDAASFATAAAHFRTALAVAEQADVPDRERFAIAAGLERALGALGERDEQRAQIQWMEALAGDRPDLRSDVAARRAWLGVHTGAFDEAIDRARTALDLARESGDVARSAEALHAWGSGLELRGRSSEAMAKLEEAADLAARLDDPRREARIRHKLATAMTGAARYERAPDLFRTVLELSREAGDRVLEARALISSAAVAMELGDGGEAEELYRAAVDLAGDIGHLELEGMGLANWGNLAYVRGQVGIALERFDRAHEAFDRAGDRSRAAQVSANAGSVRSAVMGDHRAAAASLEAARAYYEEVEDAAGLAHCLDNLGLVAWQQGDVGRAIELLEQGRELLADAEDRWMEAYNCRSRAIVHLEAGDLEAAEEAVDAGIELAHELGLDDLHASLQGVGALVAAERGHLSDARTRIERALASAGEGVQQKYLLHYWRHRILAAAGDDEEAAEAIATAYRLLRDALAGLPEEAQRRSLQDVVQHRRIARAFAARHPVCREARIAAVDAPLGRALNRDEYVDVTWTVSHPEDPPESERIERRRHRLARLGREAERQGGAPTVADLAGALDVSTSTVKRDLRALRDAGIDVPTRGSR